MCNSFAETQAPDATQTLLKTLLAENQNAKSLERACQNMQARFGAMLSFLELCFEAEDAGVKIRFADVADELYGFANAGQRGEPLDRTIMQMYAAIKERESKAEQPA